MTDENEKLVIRDDDGNEVDMSKMELVFAPGAFDSFEGTQEELNELMQGITEMFSSGEFEQAELVDMDELAEEDPEMYEKLMNAEEPRRLN